MQGKRAAMRFVLFALVGLLMEVFFTAIGEGVKGNPSIVGHTSPWMMLDYGLLGVLLEPIGGPFIRRGVPLFIRAAIYMLLIFVVEFISGEIFTAAGLKIWNYSHLAYNLDGQITLLYAPFWYGLGFVVESLYRKIDAIAVLLLRGLSAEQIEKIPA